MKKVDEKWLSEFKIKRIRYVVLQGEVFICGNINVEKSANLVLRQGFERLGWLIFGTTCENDNNNE